jgi:polyferredoxin
MYLSSRIKLSISVFAFIFLILSSIQLKIKNPIILAERFFTYTGWFEVFIVSLYGSIVAFNMYDRNKVAVWRKYTWIIFSFLFFMQLILGLLGIEKCLMTGKLHLPIPLMILSGPIYRGHLSFMTFLFLSTILLVGPAWCSHLCYFGALDNYMASKKKLAKSLNKNTIIQFKFSVLFIIIAVTLILKYFNLETYIALSLAILFGLFGIVLILFISRKKGKMIHCIAYCPIGTIVSVIKYINPIRLQINNKCNLCMHCSGVCNYNALTKENLTKGKPALTCTLCGDCLNSCNKNYISYKLFNINNEYARNIYLFLSVSLHSVFLALARI